MKTTVVEIGTKYDSKTVVVKGVFGGSLSPYDVPQRATSDYDESAKTLSVKFAYLTPHEPLKKQYHGDSGEVALWLGRKTGKLYRVTIRNVDPGSLPGVRIEISDAIQEAADLWEDVAGKPQSCVPIANLKLTKAVVEKEEELFAVK